MRMPPRASVKNRTFADYINHQADRQTTACLQLLSENSYTFHLISLSKNGKSGKIIGTHAANTSSGAVV
jgi:hypothetical protein